MSRAALAAVGAPPGAVAGADLLVAELERLGVTHVFGLPGVHNLPAWEALRTSPIRVIGVRHEQAAVYAADGYARSTGRLGVAITTTGPGAANAVAATGEAWASGSPVLVIATDISTALRRPGVYRGVLHECTDQAGLFRPVTKAVVRAGSVAALRAAVRRAAMSAQAAPSRPVYLEVPTDLLSGRASAGEDATADGPEAGPARPDDAAFDRAAALLAGARLPLIWAGGGAARAGAGEAVALLAERLGAPVLETYGARGLLAPEHPCHVGLPPHLPEAGALWDEADAVLAVGTDFDGMMTQNWRQPAPRRLVSVNVDAVDASKNYDADEVLLGDAAGAVRCLADRVPARQGAAAALQGRLEGIRIAAWQRLREQHPREVELLLSTARALPPRTAVVADMCIPGYWLAALHPFAAPRRLLYPVGWGTLGFAFPAAIGAALGDGRPVLAVCGDGGFLFACGELATLVQEGIPAVVLLVDDGGYGMLRYDQRAAGQEPFGVDLCRPDWLALAASFGIAAVRVDDPGRPLQDALRQAFATGLPSLVVLDAALDPPETTSPRWYRPTR